MLKHAPLAATVEKLVRNTSLNPGDLVLDPAAIAALGGLVATYHASFRELEGAKGIARQKALARLASTGQLKPLSSLSKTLSDADFESINQRIALLSLPADERETARLGMIKAKVMQALRSDGAITTPSGEVFIADGGSTSEELSGFAGFQQFVTDEFFGRVVQFFLEAGCLDERGAGDIMLRYSNVDASPTRKRR